MPCWLDVSWMKSLCESYLDMTIISTKCHVMSFATKFLCDLLRMTKRICSSHVVFTTEN